MSHYRIRREGMEFPVAGLEALVRLLQEGTLGPTDRVYDPSSRAWVPAAELGLLQGAFADRAREQAARRNRASRSKGPRAPLLPSVGMGPMAPPTSSSPGPDTAGTDPVFEIPADLEAHSQEHSSEPDRAVISGGNLRGSDSAGSDSAGHDDQGRSTDPGLRPRVPKAHVNAVGELIAFPDEDPQRSRLASLPPFGASLDPDQARAALDNPAAFLRSADTPPAAQAKPAVRPTLLLMTVIVALVGAFLLVSYIQHSANMYNARLTSPSGASATAQPQPRRTPEPGEATLVGEVPSTATTVPRSSDAFYDDMELQLRNRMVPGCSTIAREDDLDTALLLELSRLGVQPYSVHAPVLTWGGRKGDVPHGVEIKIFYEGQQGELDRELGAIGLVVGKYAQQYGLDVRAFEVFVKARDGSTRERALDANASKQLYLRHLSLLQFLTGETP